MLEITKEETDKIRGIAYKKHARMPMYPVEDLMQIGYMGLMRAKKTYKPNQGASFMTYAEIKVSGAIMDYIRKFDLMPTDSRILYNKTVKAQKKLEQKLLRNPTSSEVAAESGICVNKYANILRDNLIYEKVNYIDLQEKDGDFMVDHSASTPEEVYMQNERIQHVIKAIEQLSRKDRFLINARYKYRKQHKQIGRIFGIGESGAHRATDAAVKRIASHIPKEI